MANFTFREDKVKAIKASKSYYVRNFLEVMDKVMDDPVEKQLIRSTFLDNFNGFNRFVESQFNESNNDATIQG